MRVARMTVGSRPTMEPAASEVPHPASDLAEGLGASMLELGRLPVAEIAELAEREARRPRAIYQAHRWFARRLGTSFRALLTAAAIPDDGDFWATYYCGAPFSGKVILDPFVGG